MNLSHLETAALRLAIARDDPGIRSALEAFRLDRNEAILMDTLRQVARRTISETLSEAGYDGVEGEGEEEEDSDQAGDQDGEGDAGEEEASDEEEEDDDNQGLMVTKSARNHIFPILVNELVKESVLSSGDGSALLKRFQQGDEVINAALDVYDLDSDLSELVDTLQRVVRT
jgi:hypothetical protein